MWRVMIEVLEKSWNFQSSIGNTVRDYFKDTASPSHFFNVAIRCIQYCAKVMQMIIDEYRDISAIFNEILP